MQWIHIVLGSMPLESSGLSKYRCIRLAQTGDQIGRTVETLQIVINTWCCTWFAHFQCSHFVLFSLHFSNTGIHNRSFLWWWRRCINIWLEPWAAHHCWVTIFTHFTSLTLKQFNQLGSRDSAGRWPWFDTSCSQLNWCTWTTLRWCWSRW